MLIYRFGFTQTMKRILLVIIIAVFACIRGLAQDTSQSSHSLTVTIPEIALLDLEGTTSITLTPASPTEAGNSLNFASATNNGIWLNYTSIVATGKTRNVTVQITSGSVPTGLALKVSAGTIAGSGQGTFGTPTAQVTLSNLAQSIITGIGSAYTGSGTNTGHQLNYLLDILSLNNYDQIVQGNTTVTVTYTISEDN